MQAALAEHMVAIPSVCVIAIIQHCLVLTTAIYSKLAASTQLIAEQAAISGTVNLYIGDQSAAGTLFNIRQCLYNS